MFCSVHLHISRKSFFFPVSGNFKIVRFNWRRYFFFLYISLSSSNSFCPHNVLFPCIAHFFGIPAHTSRPLAFASPYPSDFVTFISIRYQELYWLLIYTKTIQNDEKHAEKIKPLRSQTQTWSLERAASLLFVLQQTNEQHTLLCSQHTKGYRNKSSNCKEVINTSWNA
jgi:hypothetical protein